MKLGEQRVLLPDSAPFSLSGYARLRKVLVSNEARHPPQLLLQNGLALNRSPSRLDQWTKKLATWRCASGRLELAIPEEQLTRTHATIRTIFWDVGGVILTNGWDKGQRTRVLGRLGVDLVAYEAAHERANYYWERGLTTAEDFFMQTVLRPNPRLNLTYESLWPQVCAESKVLHAECLDLLAQLKQSGSWRLATLNNESRELNEYRLDNFKLRTLFDYFICSGYIHEMKPAAGIFESAIDISGFPARSALFVDDKAENCEAAEALGMCAIRFQSPVQLYSDLKAFGIQV